jgi:hypothetical protein
MASIQRAFDVRIGEHLIDTVYGDASLTARDMRNSLISHDNYPSQISVYRNTPNKRAYDSVARCTHLDEL